jgi:hypothetical protein
METNQTISPSNPNPKRKGKMSKENISAALSELAKGKGMPEIAKVYGVTRNTIRYHAIRAGLLPDYPTAKEGRAEEISRLREENRLLKLIVADKALESRLRMNR